MATKVYTFHITYEGLEEKIWRKVEVSSIQSRQRFRQHGLQIAVDIKGVNLLCRFGKRAR